MHRRAASGSGAGGVAAGLVGRFTSGRSSARQKIQAGNDGRPRCAPTLALTAAGAATSLRFRMPEVSVAALDPRHQKMIENARVALERGNLDYVLEVTAQVLKAQPGCLPVRKLQRVAQLRQSKGKGGFMSRMSAGISNAPLMFGGGKKDPAKLLESAEGLLAKDPANVPALKLLAEAAGAL